MTTTYRSRTVWAAAYLVALAHQGALLFVGFAFLVRVWREMPEGPLWPLWIIFLPFALLSMVLARWAADGAEQRFGRRHGPRP